MNDIAEYLEQVKTFTDGCREKVGSSGTLEEVLTDVEDLASEDELETDKEISITENGTISIDPSVGYKGIKNLEITTNVEPEITLQDKSVSITSNGTTTVNKDSGYDGINSVSITTNVSPILEEKSVVPTEENQTITPSSGKDGLSQVNVSRIPTEYTKQEGEIEITSDGTYDVSGVLSATVNVGEHETNYLIFDDIEDSWTMKSTMPSDYVELQYVQFPRGSYINTSLSPQNHEKIFAIDSGSGYNAFGTLCGTKNDVSDIIITYRSINSSGYVTFEVNNDLQKGVNGIANDTTHFNYCFEIDNDLMKYGFYSANKGSSIDKTVPSITLNKNFTVKTTLNDLPYFLGAYNNNGVAANFANNSGRIYIFQHWTNGILDRDMIPAKRVSDNVCGMYDKVNDVFYTNAGTGTITGGPEVTA